MKRLMDLAELGRAEVAVLIWVAEHGVYCEWERPTDRRVVVGDERIELDLASFRVAVGKLWEFRCLQCFEGKNYRLTAFGRDLANAFRSRAEERAALLREYRRPLG